MTVKRENEIIRSHTVVRLVTSDNNLIIKTYVRMVEMVEKRWKSSARTVVSPWFASRGGIYL